MIKRSAPLDIQTTNMNSELSQLDTLISVAKKKWGTKALSLMTIEELTTMVQQVANEDSLPEVALPII